MNRKLRVLCFGRFCDEVPGGTQSHVESLCHSLKDSIEFVNLVPSRDRKTAIFHNGAAQVHRMAGYSVGNSVSLSWRMVLQAVLLHRKHKFDLIHLHFPDPMSHIASWFLPSSIPRVISWHADILRQRKLLFFYKPFLIRALNSASAVLVATPAHVTSSLFLPLMRDKSRLKVVPYGIDPTRFQQLGENAQSVIAPIVHKLNGRTLVFALGRHVYYKGFDILIAAMAQAQGSCFLVLGGNGPLTPELKSQVKQLGLEQSVHFAGYIPNQDLPAWFSAADIFCLPSIAKTEAFGLVQLEAMAAGTPVVSTMLNNGVDYVNEHETTGLVIQPSDTNQLANALLMLADRPDLREKMGQAGMERVKTMFSEKVMSELTLSAYQGCLVSRRSIN